MLMSSEDVVQSVNHCIHRYHHSSYKSVVGFDEIYEALADIVYELKIREFQTDPNEVLRLTEILLEDKQLLDTVRLPIRTVYRFSNCLAILKVKFGECEETINEIELKHIETVPEKWKGADIADSLSQRFYSSPEEFCQYADDLLWLLERPLKKTEIDEIESPYSVTVTIPHIHTKFRLTAYSFSNTDRHIWQAERIS